MTDDLNIYRAAKVMTDHHGENARTEALDRMKKFHALGNEQAQAVWFRISEAIKAIQSTDKPEKVN